MIYQSPTDKYSMKPKKQYFTVSQALVLAAGAASFAALSTALLASHMFTANFPPPSEEPYFEGPKGTIYSRTVFASNQMTAREWSHWGRENSLFLRKKKKGAFRGQLTSSPSKLLTTKFDEATVPKPETDDGIGPHVAWLMSFPNSGTSFTLHLTREASNSTTATNYALEGEIKDKPSVPAIPGEEGTEGPWLQLIPNRTTEVPKYYLTKTHCGGYCTYCPGDRYIETPRSFQVACLSGTKALESKEGGIKKSPTTYESKLVKKAIHIFRHPLDNIVARFHLDHRRQVKSGENGDNMLHWPEVFPKNSTGFHQWCEFVDSHEDLSDLYWIDPKLHDAMVGVPCKVEFFRYVQWHNNAFMVTNEMNIPVMLLHYRDYSIRYEETLDRILDFLDLKRKGRDLEFISGKEYRDYYSSEQKQKIYNFLEEFSTGETWNELRTYNFDDETLTTL